MISAILKVCNFTLICNPLVMYNMEHLFICLFAISYLIRLEKAMAPHSSTLAWKIPWMEEPGRLQTVGSRRVGHDWATSLSLFTFMYWRRKWQPTPVFLPGESRGRRSLVGCRLWGRTGSDTTEVTQQHLIRYLISSFDHFLIGLFAFLLLSFKSSFYILDTCTLSDTYFAKIFF